jgi:AraC family transcriptional regulator of adaptative response / DNA-3-methyladenine glycosylase II
MIQDMDTAATLPADDACYNALKARDARFDGHFFTGVTSTGIYCRPVCRVKTPKRENCRFFRFAAQAETEGFRPCLRCRPELAPRSPALAGTGLPAWSSYDAASILARQAAALLDAPETWLDAAPSLPQLAERLGVSDRHVRRVFEAEFGVSPLQYLQTRRLLTAKQLLTDTDLAITQVAHLSGFASLRRFNAAFSEHYGLNPTQLRRDSDTKAPARAGQGVTVRASYRPPYDVPAMLAFLHARSLLGVECLVADDGHGSRFGRTVRLEHGGKHYRGWFMGRFNEARHQVELQLSASLLDVLPLATARLRAMLDLDADPLAINAVLDAQFPQGSGLRVPGTMDGYELAVRAVLGQQITVAAARTLATRLVARFGESLETPYAELTHLFPAPQVLAQASGDALGQLGIVKQRQAAIVAIAQAVAQGRLRLVPGADVTATMDQLKELPGIGDWTAQYIAMRALRWPDAFPAGDVALHKALGVQGMKNPAKEAEARSQACKPWRSYAVVRAWATLNSAGAITK